MLLNRAEPPPWAATGDEEDLDVAFEDHWEANAQRGGDRRDVQDRLRPVDPWDPPQQLWRRVLRAVRVPQLAATVVFLLAIAITLGIIWSQSHNPNEGAAEIATLAAERAQSSTAGPAALESSNEGPAATAAQGGATRAEGGAVTLFVHIVGEVQAPGVFELSAGARVRDAVEAAGGATEAGVLAGVNLARPVVDGEQIVVPNAEQAELGTVPLLADAGAGVTVPGAVIDLNTADAVQLETLPGVGPAIAARIVAWRTANGYFGSVEQLVNVPGIGAKTLDGFRDRVRTS